MNAHRNISVRPLAAAVSNRTGRAGFTVVEMLVIVAIIGLLVTIFMPAMGKFILATKKAKSQATIHLIDGACSYYFDDFENYPPSREATAYNGWHGSQLIVLFLTGYGPDPDPKGEPSGALNVDDGKSDYGFRIVPRGRVYGPYNGCEKIETKKILDGNGAERPVFVDVFGNPILYYRWTGSGYESAHNADGPDNLDTHYAKTGDDVYYRTDFILISKGPNGEWNAPRDGDSDDITNFFTD